MMKIMSDADIEIFAQRIGVDLNTVDLDSIDLPPGYDSITVRLDFSSGTPILVLFPDENTILPKIY